MRQSKILTFFVLVLLVLLQVVSCQSRLQSLKNTVFQKASTLSDDDIEGQVDFYTELEMFLQQATYLRSKLYSELDKATMMGVRGGAECIKLRRSISIINGVTADLQRVIESDLVCPPPEDDVLATIHKSPIFEGSQNAPMSFLASRLSKFRKATKIFTTRSFAHSSVAAEFHRACDNIPNTLVIIKSGQYIAGGFTEPTWESPSAYYRKRSSSADAFFMFSMNKQRIYPYRPNQDGIDVDRGFGPTFGGSSPYPLIVSDDYKSKDNGSTLTGESFDFSQISSPQEELFGGPRFSIDEYEVYKLE